MLQQCFVCEAIIQAGNDNYLFFLRAKPSSMKPSSASNPQQQLGNRRVGIPDKINVVMEPLISNAGAKF
jgi:hypothetical protein